MNISLVPAKSKSFSDRWPLMNSLRFCSRELQFSRRCRLQWKIVLLKVPVSRKIKTLSKTFRTDTHSYNNTMRTVYVPIPLKVGNSVWHPLILPFAYTYVYTADTLYSFRAIYFHEIVYCSWGKFWIISDDVCVLARTAQHITYIYDIRSFATGVLVFETTIALNTFSEKTEKSRKHWVCKSWCQVNECIG